MFIDIDYNINILMCINTSPLEILIFMRNNSKEYMSWRLENTIIQYIVIKKKEY